MPNDAKIPESTLELLARSIYKESSAYGFKHADYLRLVNHILDATMQNGANEPDLLPAKNSKVNIANVTAMPLIGDQVIIRPYNASDDLVRVNNWIQDNIGRYFLLSCQSMSSPQLEGLLSHSTSQVGIITLPDEKPIGIIAYLDFNCYQRKAELRKMIGDVVYRGKGLAREATQMWIDYGFKTLKLHKIYVNTLHHNLRNIKLNEDLGFQVEGILRNEVYFDGTYHDVLRMGLVA